MQQPIQETKPPHVVVDATAVSCSLTKDNLDEYLAQSGYGANVGMFSCYFVRDAHTGAPLCITCGRPIGEHPSAAVAIQEPTVTVVTVTEMTPLPDGLTIGEAQDVFEMNLSYTPVFGVVVLSVFVAIELFIFLGMGLYRNTPYVFIVPAIMLMMIMYLVLKARVSRIVFSKGRGPLSPVVVTRRRLCGCESETHTTVAGLGQIAFRETQYRRSIVFTVLAISTSGDETELHITHGYDDAVTQYNAWQAYFSLYGVAAHPEWIPTVVIVHHS